MGPHRHQQCGEGPEPRPRGKKADLVVFDAPTVEDTATFEDPHRYPVGIPHVLVSGVPVIRDRAHTGARPGRALRKS